MQVKYNITYSSTLFDLLKTYSSILQKAEKINHLTISYSELYSVDDAIQRLKSMFGQLTEWTNFLNLIPKFNGNKVINKSILSSNFVASLELTKEYSALKFTKLF